MQTVTRAASLPYRTDSQLTGKLIVTRNLEQNWCCKVCPTTWDHSSVLSVNVRTQRLHVKVKVFPVQHNTAPHQYLPSDYLIAIPFLAGGSILLLPFCGATDLLLSPKTAPPPFWIHKIEQTHICSRITNVY